jgi:methyl-accepting chemotaxis protein
MIDLNVKQRLIAMRRNLAALSWRGPAESERLGDLLYDDLAAPTNSGGVSWRGDAIASDDKQGDGPATPAQRAAVLALADRVRAESDALLRLMGRARDEADRLAIPVTELSRDALAATVRDVADIALEASLAGIRAGAATRGFSVVAQDFEVLADGMRMAWHTVEPHLVRVEDGAAETACLAARTKSLVRCIGADDLDIGFAASEDADMLRRKAVEACRTLADLCEDVADQADRLARDLVVLVRQSPVGNRRSADRVPFDVGCRLVTATGAFWGRTRDLSRTGALVALRPMPDLHRAQPVTLLLRDIGALTGVIVGVSAGGAHVSFDLAQSANAATRPVLMAALSGVEDENEALAERCRMLSEEVVDAFEAGLESGVTTLEDLLSPTHEVLGGDAVASAAQAFYAAFLPPILGRHLRPAEGDVSTMAMDRNGYTPLAMTSGHGSGGDPSHGRVHGDHASLRAARNLAPSLVQILPRSAEAESKPLRSAAAPIFIRGRHWGCVVINSALDEAEAVAAA